MALSGEYISYSVEDFKVGLLLTDNAVDGLTYGDWIDIPGITKVAGKSQIKSQELRGDNKQIAQQSNYVGDEIQFEYSKVSILAQEAIIGGDLTNTGITPSQVMTYKFGGSGAVLPYFRMQAKSPRLSDSDIADEHTLWYKCKVTDISSTSLEDQNFNTRMVTVQAIEPIMATNIGEIILHETETQIDVP